jgi:hypothetical protein
MTQLPFQLLHFNMALLLDPLDLLLFPFSPNLIEVTQQLVDECRSKLIAMLQSEIMGCFERFIWRPLLLLFC